MFKYETVRSILIKADLESLIRMGATQDEYDGESERLTNRLNAEQPNSLESVLTVLCSVFAESFGFTATYSMNNNTSYRFKYEVSKESMPKFVAAAERIWETEEP